MLALATLRTRWRSFVGSFVAVALGVAVLAAALLVFDSARPAAPPRLAAADVVVRGPEADGRRIWSGRSCRGRPTGPGRWPTAWPGCPA